MNALATRCVLSFATFAMLLVVTSPAASDESGAKVYTSGLKSSVQVIVEIEKGIAMGSGSLVNKKDGYLITNWHVVHDAKEIIVLFPIFDKAGKPVGESDRYRSQAKKLALPCRVIAMDQKIDIAIIKITDMSKLPKNVQAVKFAPDSPFTGDTIHSIGNPAASDSMWIYTPGKVRQVYNKKWKSSGGDGVINSHECKIIEATSPTSPGDSGGPCFNDKGEQVGVTQGGMVAAVAQGYSYFVDATEVKKFLKKHKVAFNVAEEVVVNGDSTPATDSSTKSEADPKKDSKDTKDTTVVKKDTPKKDPAGDELAKQEKEANSRLNLIRPLVKDSTRKSFAVEQLNKIVKLYPKTEAAKEAQSLLKQIQ